MSAFFPIPPASSPEEGEATTLFDLHRQRVWAERRWQVRAAQFRALALAESIFAGRVSAQLSGTRLEGPFRGLLHLEVPFESLEDHLEREQRFTAVAGRDPVLARSPFVFVFSAAGAR